MRLDHIQTGQVLKAVRLNRDPCGKPQQEDPQRGSHTGGQLVDECRQGKEDARTILAGLIAGILNGVGGKKGLGNVGNITGCRLQHQKHRDYKKVVVTEKVDHPIQHRRQQTAGHIHSLFAKFFAEFIGVQLGDQLRKKRNGDGHN